MSDEQQKSPHQRMVELQARIEKTRKARLFLAQRKGREAMFWSLGLVCLSLATTFVSVFGLVALVSPKINAAVIVLSVLSTLGSVWETASGPNLLLNEIYEGAKAMQKLLHRIEGLNVSALTHEDVTKIADEYTDTLGRPEHNHSAADFRISSSSGGFWSYVSAYSKVFVFGFVIVASVVFVVLLLSTGPSVDALRSVDAGIP